MKTKRSILATLCLLAGVFMLCVCTASANDGGGNPQGSAPAATQSPGSPGPDRAPSPLDEASRTARIAENKRWRVELQKYVEDLKASNCRTPERTLALRALQTARHWLGEDLAIAGAPYPYPNGNDPTSKIVDPPADVAPETQG